MKASRRNFLKSAGTGAMAVPFFFRSVGARSKKENGSVDYGELDSVLSEPVLKTDLFKEAVIIENVELLRYNNNFICRVTSKEGSTGLSVSNNMQMIHLYPIFVDRIQPFFIGKNALELEKLLGQVYVHMSNYKLQSLAFWVPLATLEFAILDFLGKISGKPIGELIGDIHHEEIFVYQANNFRGKSAEESIELIKRQVDETDAKALKFKVGGRMNNEERPRGNPKNSFRWSGIVLVLRWPSMPMPTAPMG